MNVFADSNDPVETQTGTATGRGLPGGGRAEAQTVWAQWAVSGSWWEFSCQLV